MPRLLLGLGFVLLGACSRFDDPTLNDIDQSLLELPAPALRMVPHNANRNLLWGDLHIHTALSYDAFTMGTRALPDDAYRFMKGETIMHGYGYPIRAGRPLDFGAVTDHSEYLGVPRHLAGGDSDKPDQRVIDALKDGNALKYSALYLHRVLSKMASRETREKIFGSDDLKPVSESAWHELIAAAEHHNDPGRFTTFVAYEWSSMPDGRNLHRNVIYRSSEAPDYPFSSRDSSNPEDLWDELDRQRELGMDALAIPHNGNVSGGRMYEATNFNGDSVTAEYSAQRQRNEPLSEIFQIKGTSETHPQLSPRDEFADFEIMDILLKAVTEFSEPRGSYARDALRTGLEFAHREGFSPFQFGVIGSSDSHNASFSVEEDNYHGKLPLLDGTPAQRLGLAVISPEMSRVTAYGAAGLVAVWAEENTRESLFKAMKRKETYATSGPRISLRFFAGSGYHPDMLAEEWLEQAYAMGVPMGAELVAPVDGSPSFILAAMKDPLGADLARLQIIKAWVDKAGVSHEQVIDLSSSEGQGELSVVWEDPEYDPTQHALYYARAIQVPTRRYSTYDAEVLGIEPPAPVTIRERAVSSAIWLKPAVNKDTEPFY